MMSLVLTVAAVVAGLVFLVVGGFSILSLLWGDLLENDEGAAPHEVSRVA